MKTWLAYNWLKLLALTMAVGAIYSQLPYVYYQVTSWVILMAALVVAQQAHSHDRPTLMWVVIFTAIVFNPFSLLSISQVYVWQMLYLAGAFIFFSSLFLLKSPK